MTINIFKISTVCFCCLLLISCKLAEKDNKEEQIRLNTAEQSSDTLMNSIQGNVEINQILTRPNSVVLTGLPEHRLITVYKFKTPAKAEQYSSFYRASNDYYDDDYTTEDHFIPGIEMIYGYNLLNIGHYNLKTEKLNFFFDKPVLIKTLYYPSFIQDSLDEKPIIRNYYFVSVYDGDTNKDTLINKKDLRRFYHLNADCNTKTRLIPEEYSVLRSQYDYKNDVMYLFAIYDENRNGVGDNTEPIHIFWVDLKDPQPAKKMY